MTHTKALLKAAISMGNLATNQTPENKKLLKIKHGRPNLELVPAKVRLEDITEKLLKHPRTVLKAHAMQTQVKPCNMSKWPSTRHGVYARQKRKKLCPTYKFDQ